MHSEAHVEICQSGKSKIGKITARFLQKQGSAYKSLLLIGFLSVIIFTGNYAVKLCKEDANFCTLEFQYVNVMHFLLLQGGLLPLQTLRSLPQTLKLLSLTPAPNTNILNTNYT